MALVKCSNCEKELKKGDSFCTKCGRKNNYITRKIKNIIKIGRVFYNKNKKMVIILIIIIAILVFLIVDNIRFNKEIINAEYYYSNEEYSKAEKIIDKYPLHFYNYTYKKIKSTESLTTYYEFYETHIDYAENTGLSEAYKTAMVELIEGYENCVKEIDISTGIKKSTVQELSKTYMNKLYDVFDIDESKLKEIISLDSKKRESEVDDIADAIAKSKVCKLNNILVAGYNKSGYKLTVKIKNNNGCSWNIKSYSEIRVNFTDGSYEDAYLGVNINLKGGESYTFYDCYLGSNNKSKTVKSVSFID